MGNGRGRTIVSRCQLSLLLTPLAIPMIFKCVAMYVCKAFMCVNVGVHVQYSKCRGQRQPRVLIASSRLVRDKVSC